ncbi:MAG: hypothetical protein LBK28_05745 [Propionibacteriaceae bacterium]|jgi:hypothetical protein|nr:hypothetical protein [Propionibacteriaceae bacterium]
MKRWVLAVAILVGLVICVGLVVLWVSAQSGAGDTGQVIGWVADSDGQPVPECVVEPVPHDPELQAVETETITDETGKFVARLGAGEWTIKFQCSADPGGSAHVVPVRANADTEIHFEIPLR